MSSSPELVKHNTIFGRGYLKVHEFVSVLKFQLSPVIDAIIFVGHPFLPQDHTAKDISTRSLAPSRVPQANERIYGPDHEVVEKPVGLTKAVNFAIGLLGSFFVLGEHPIDKSNL